MGEKFYAKGPGNEGYIKNLEVIAYHDAEKENLFQMALYKTEEGKYYLYAVSFAGLGCTIFDVTDAANPRYIKKMLPVDPEEYPATTTCKIQICEDLMMLSLSTGGGAWFGTTGDSSKAKTLCGLLIYSLKDDPENPKKLSFWDNGVAGGNGVHRFSYNGGRYVHLSSDCNGFYGMIYRILDIEDPTDPKEVGRWWLPEQFVDGQIGKSFDPLAPHVPYFMDQCHMHGPAMIKDDLAYIGYFGAGLVILDVHDITRPKLIGQLKLHPPFGGEMSGARCHTALPLPGRDYCVVTNEGERFRMMDTKKLNHTAQPLNTIHMVDVHDPTKPTLVAIFPYPEVPEDYPYKNFNELSLGMPGPFGPHNIHEPMSNKPWLDQDPNKIYCCYFHAGLRVFDTSDPYNIKEIAYFIPPTPIEDRLENMPGPLVPCTEDLVVDDRGNIIINALEDGIYILRLKSEKGVKK